MIDYDNFKGLPTSGKELTEELKTKLDDATYYALLEAWQRAPIGYFRMDSPVTKYFQMVMGEKRDRDLAAAVDASKRIMRGGE
jgi:hypothetical protein